MNTCDKIKKNAFLYHENALEPSLRQEVQHHLDECMGCRKKFQQALLINKSMKSLPKHDTSSDFNTVLRARLRTEAYRKPFFSFSYDFGFWRMPAFGALALMFISIGVVLQRNWSLAPLPMADNNVVAIRSGSMQVVQQPRNVSSRTSIKHTEVKNYVDPGSLTDMKKWVKQRGLRNQATLERLNEDSTRQRNYQPYLDETLVRQVKQVRF
jgi:hypothetical protein